MTAVLYQRYFRTDLGAEYFWDGTQWLSTQIYSFEHYSGNSTAGGIATASLISATTSLLQRWPVWGGQDMWLETFHLSVFVASGGTNLGASHLWTVGFHKTDAASTTTNIATRTINSHPTGTYDTWFTVASGSIQALVGTGIDKIEYGVNKTGTPGAIHLLPRLSYRKVAT